MCKNSIVNMCLFLVLMLNFSQIKSQELYKLENSNNINSFNTYLLFFSDGEYFLVSEYYLGLSSKQYSQFDNSIDVKPILFTLSAGSFKKRNDTYLLLDKKYGFTQIFNISGNEIVGFKTFEFLINKEFSPVKQDYSTNLNREILFYEFGVFSKENMTEIFNLQSKKSKKWENLNSNNTFDKPIKLENGIYYQQNGLFNLTIKDNHFTYRLCKMELLKGVFNYTMGFISIDCSTLNFTQSIEFLTNTKFYVKSLVGLPPNEVFELKENDIIDQCNE